MVALASDPPPWIGDEQGYFWTALSILQDGLQDPFNQQGLYGHSPTLGSAYTAGVMMVFGADEFGWRMAGALSVFVAGVGVYTLGRMLFDPLAATIAGSVFLLSHYLTGFAILGYNNQDALPPMVWAVCAVLTAIHGPARIRQSVFFALAGLILGWGFYTHYGARLAVPVVGLVIIQGMKINDWWRAYPMAATFLAAVIPTLAHGSNVEGIRYVMLGSPLTSDPLLAKLQINIVQNTAAWWQDRNPTHYVRGSLIDPLSGILAVAGLYRPHLLLLEWLAITYVASAWLTPRPEIASTRMFLMLPPLALMAGCGGALVIRWLPATHRWLGLAILLLAIGYWNLTRLI